MSTLKQELPPPGGFKSVQYERIPLKKYWPASVKWLGMLAAFGYGVYSYKTAKDEVRWNAIERKAGFLSILPLLVAENDRMKLRTFRRFRDYEAEIMKDVDGWVVGTYRGEPIYKTVKPDEWFDPRGLEPWAYTDPDEFDYLKKMSTDN